MEETSSPRLDIDSVLGEVVIVLGMRPKRLTCRSMVSTSCPGSDSFDLPMILAGTPTAVACDGMLRNRTEPAPIFAESPTEMFPSRSDPAPIKTCFPTFGCLSPTRKIPRVASEASLEKLVPIYGDWLKPKRT